jgi:hypothetical protein
LCNSPVEGIGGHCVHTERLVQPAQEVIRRQVAVFQLLAVRPDLVVDELAHGVAHHLELFGPFEHGAHRTGIAALRIRASRRRASTGDRRHRAAREGFSQPRDAPMHAP